VSKHLAAYVDRLTIALAGIDGMLAVGQFLIQQPDVPFGLAPVPLEAGELDLW
jgi:hypothetical protein